MPTDMFQPTSTVLSTSERAPRREQLQPRFESDAPTSDAISTAMGPLEFETYRKWWRTSLRFRLHNADIAAIRAIDKAEEQARAAVEKNMHGGGDWSNSPAKSASHSHRARALVIDDDDDRDELALRSRSDSDGRPIGAGVVAASLLFARMFDARPGLLDGVRNSGTPVIVIDVPDGAVFQRVSTTWRGVLFNGDARLMDLARDSVTRREEVDASYLVVKDPPKRGTKTSEDATALSMLAFALPMIGISPLGRTHLPEAINSAATDLLELPPLDAAAIMRTIRIVTGKVCREPIDLEACAGATLTDLEIAVRFDRTPQQCFSELRRLRAPKEAKKKSRDLRLAQLHGLGEARRWAEGAIADIQAWKRGEISWDNVSSAVALNGPPGCGKTTFASVFAEEAGLNLVSATLAQWQSSGDAHLGHLLRAMHRDFETARSLAPSCLFIDEIDSFPDRAGVTHSHRDYVVEVVNALLAEIDGMAGLEGVVLIGASNDIGRCDSALLRAGRLDRVVHIALPDVSELEKMFRVRLGSDLPHEDLAPIAELAVGMTGADVERAVKDARRLARRDGGRPLVLSDLQSALLEDDDRPEELRWRACIHEAAHILVDVIHFGPQNVFARTAKMAGRFGMSVRSKLDPYGGTPADYRKRLEVILAGRTAEELIFGSPSHGAGGASGSDLHTATDLACAMVGSLGLAGPTPLTYLGAAREAGTFLAFAEVRAAVAHELSEAARSCGSLLKEHRGVLETAARRLATEGRIDGDAILALLAERGRKPVPEWSDADKGEIEERPPSMGGPAI